MATVIDRSKTNTNKSAANKQRFIKRNKDRIKSSIRDRFINGKIDSIQNGQGQDINIDGSSTQEYQFTHDSTTGNKHHVLPGNPGWYKGDTMPKPDGKGGAGNTPGEGDGNPEDFIFHLNEEEYRKLLFEYLELPDFIKKSLKDSTEYKMERAGFKRSGSPAQLSLIKSYLNSYARRLIMESDIDEIIDSLEDQKTYDTTELENIELEIASLNKEKDELTLFEEDDLRYKNWDKKLHKINSAVMFCIMDVSGSMSTPLKLRSKKFFYLLYLFLSAKYEHVTIRFLAHTDTAFELNEREFFHGNHSGSTKILSAYELMNDIIKKEYKSSDYNIYLAQATDGDCWGNDIKESAQFLSDIILPQIQYGAYLEVVGTSYYSKAVSDYILELRRLITNPKFQIRSASNDQEVFEIFIDLFKKRG